MRRSISRRKFIKLTAAGTIGAALPQFAISPKRREDKPNVLFIAIDDLNDWIGCLRGHPDVKTPNLDRLAKRGVLFTNAFCSAPACNPSRASLLTGILPSTSGVYHNDQPWRPVLPDAVTIPQHFMAHDYNVLGGGKIFHSKKNPDPRSWHKYFPSETLTKLHDPVPPYRPLSGLPYIAPLDWGPLEVMDEEMGDWKVANWAINQLDKRHEKPFFLAVGISKPHLPWYVPRKYFEMYPPDKIRLPMVKEGDLDDVPLITNKVVLAKGDYGRIVRYDKWREAVSAYLANISFADACIGRIIDALESSPYADNTMIILWSDNGFHLGEKLHWRKYTLWEEATHIVLMIVAPGFAEPGGCCTRPVSLIDIFPTLIDLCRLSPNKKLEGKSLVPLLKVPNGAWERPALTTYGRNNHSLRTERWRYIRYSDGAEELYDHRKDELEWINLADKPEYEEVKRELSLWLPKVNAPDAPRGEE